MRTPETIFRVVMWRVVMVMWRKLIQELHTYTCRQIHETTLNLTSDKHLLSYIEVTSVTRALWVSAPPSL